MEHDNFVSDVTNEMLSEYSVFVKKELKFRL